MRQALLILLGFFLLAGSLVATAGTMQLRDFELRGYVDPTQDQHLPYAVARPGLNVELRQYSPEDLQANLELIAASNFVWIRQFVHWDEVELQPGQYDWAQWDRIFERLEDFPQLEPVIVLMNTPEWARVKHPTVVVTESGPPESVEDFAAFASTFARRYGGAVDHYQIWDEPNLDDAWGLLAPSPAEYVALLDAAARAIRGADESATILAAGLAPTSETAGQNISDWRYLDAMYRLGAADAMDIVAGKPYGFDTSPLDRRVDEGLLNFSRIVGLREVMLKHGDGRTALWASNWGWNALPADWTGEASIWGGVTDAEQVQFALQAFDRVHRELPWLGAMFLHHWQPDAERDDAQWGFALRAIDGSPTALLGAIQEYSFPNAAQNGLFHPRTQFARYSGVWQFSELGADIGWLETSDSRFELDFYGSDIALLLREGDYIAFLYPMVDGEQANETARDTDGNAYVFLRSDSRAQETSLAAISRNLDLGEHTLQVVADRGWDRWAIAGFAVSSGNLRALYDGQIAIAIFASVLSGLVLAGALSTAPWRLWQGSLRRLYGGLSATSNLVLSAIASLAMLIALSWTWTAQRPTIFVRGEINPVLALLTGGIFYLSPSIVLTIAAAVLLFVLIYHRLESGLILTLFWAPFFLFPVELYLYALPMAEAMLLITALAALAKMLVWLGLQYQSYNSSYSLQPRALLGHLNAIDFAVAGLVLVAFISLTWTRRMDVALTELRTLIIEPLLFYAIFRSLDPEGPTLRRLVLAILGAAILVCLIGLVGYFTGQNVITAEGEARRLVSVYGSPNNVGLLLGRTMPFVFAFLLVTVNQRRRIVAALALLIMGSALLLTQSVGALLLGIPAAAVLILIGRFRRRAILPLVILIVIAIVSFAALSQVSARFANILDIGSGTTFLRMRLWESAIDMIRDYPLTGIGLDQFLYLYSGEYVRPDAIWDLELSHPHNVILDFWTRLGLAGLALFALIQVAFWRRALRLLARLRQLDLEIAAMTLGVIGSMAALLAHGLIDNSVFVNDLAIIFVFQLVLLIHLESIAKDTEAHRE